MCNCGTIPDVQKELLLPCSLTGRYSDELLRAGRGSWTKAGVVVLKHPAVSAPWAHSGLQNRGISQTQGAAVLSKVGAKWSNTGALYFPETSHYITPSLCTPSPIRPHPLSEQWSHPKVEHAVIRVESLWLLGVHLVKLNKHMQPSSSSRVTKIEIIKEIRNKSSLSHFKTVYIGCNIMGGPKVIQWSAVFVSNIWWYFIIVYSRPVCMLTEWNRVQYSLHWPPVQGCLHHGSWERKDSGAVKNKSYQEYLVMGLLCLQTPVSYMYLYSSVVQCVTINNN